MKVTLNKVFTSVKETKYGEKLSVGLKINEKQVNDIDGNTVDVNDRYINAWFPKDTRFPYNEGDTIDIRVKQRGDYLDFQLINDMPKPGQAAVSDTRISNLESRVAKLEEIIANTPAVSDPTETVPDDPDNF